MCIRLDQIWSMSIRSCRNFYRKCEQTSIQFCVLKFPTEAQKFPIYRYNAAEFPPVFSFKFQSLKQEFDCYRAVDEIERVKVKIEKFRMTRTIIHRGFL